MERVGRRWVVLLLCVSIVSAGLLTAQGAERGFGFGGGLAAAFFPDLSEVNAFLSDNDLDPFGDVLIGSGGNGRGGVIGGPVLGGIGWGVFTASQKENRRAELVFGGGGFDMGLAVGGDDSSVLTVGAVFGGGAAVLTITGAEFAPTGRAPSAIIIEPDERTLGRVIGFVEPYVSLEAQLLQWLGLELRVGYVLPLVGFDFGDFLGVSAPSLDLSGVMVSVGLAFGGITTAGPEEAASAMRGTAAVAPTDTLRVENTMGDLVIISVPVDTTQTGSQQAVLWTAIPERRDGEVRVDVETTAAGVALRTVGKGRVDYEVHVPAGINLELKNGVGRVAVSAHEAASIVVENGVGETDLQQLTAGSLVVAAGIGDVTLIAPQISSVVVNLGIGRVTLALPGNAAATVKARTGVGGVSYAAFPGMSGGASGFLGKSGEIVLGGGGSMFDLGVGLGDIDLQRLAP